MKIVRFLYKKRIGWGVLEKGAVRGLRGEPFKKIAFSGNKMPLEKIELLAPASPGKIVLVGLNYRDHAQEMKMPVPDEPVIFLKPATAMIGPGKRIVYPQGVGRLDYEAELALVIKKQGKNIPQENTGEYILGFSCLNDVTARDLQKKDSQWTRAKSFDTFCPMGPCLETEFDPSNAGIRSYLNGKIMQDSDTSNFIFPANYVVSFISKIMTLFPGDIISTGTPKGIGEMHPDDKIEVEIEGIGRLINFVVSFNNEKE